MAENKVVWNINSILNSLTKDERKNIKTNPAEVAKKWGVQQAEFLKKLAELKKIDDELHETLITFSVAMKKFKAELPQHQEKVYEVFRNLCQELDRAFREPAQATTKALHILTKAVI